MTSEVGVTRLTTMSGKSPKTSRRRILPEVVVSLTDICRTSGNLGEKTWETLDDTDSAFEGADDVWLPHVRRRQQEGGTVRMGCHRCLRCVRHSRILLLADHIRED